MDSKTQKRGERCADIAQAFGDECHLLSTWANEIVRLSLYPDIPDEVLLKLWRELGEYTQFLGSRVLRYTGEKLFIERGALI